MDTILFLVAGPVFLLSAAAHIYVKLRFRPKTCDVDDYYHEFEDLHPGLTKYQRWSKITFVAAVLAVMLLFITVVI